MFWNGLDGCWERQPEINRRRKEKILEEEFAFPSLFLLLKTKVHKTDTYRFKKVWFDQSIKRIVLCLKGGYTLVITTNSSPVGLTLPYCTTVTCTEEESYIGLYQQQLLLVTYTVLRHISLICNGFRVSKGFNNISIFKKCLCIKKFLRLFISFKGTGHLW